MSNEVLGLIQNGVGIPNADTRYVSISGAESTYTKWVYPYTPGTYTVNTMTRVGEWTTISNTTTDDFPAPEPVGDSFYTSGISGAPPWNVTTDTERLITTGQRYSFPEDTSFAIKSWRLWIEQASEEITYEVWLVRDPLGTPIYENILNERTFSETGWVELNVPEEFVQRELVIDIVLLTRSNVGETSSSAVWDFKRKSNNSAPDDGEAWMNSSGRLRISHVDDGSTNQETLLDSVLPGDSIQFGGNAYEVILATPELTYNEYIVSPATRPNEDTYTFTFFVQAAQDIDYVSITNHFSGVSEISGFFSDSGYGNITVNKDAYGIDIRIQEYIQSENWDVMAYAGNDLTSQRVLVEIDDIQDRIDKLPVSYTITVSPSAGEFNSIKEAVDYANARATDTERYLVYVYPGIYTEPEITINSRVEVQGLAEGNLATVVRAEDPNQACFKMNLISSLSNIQVTEANGISGVGIEGIGSGADVNNVLVSNCTTGFMSKGLGTELTLNQCDYLKTASFAVSGVDVGVCVSDGASLNINNARVFALPFVTQNINRGIKIEGDGSFLRGQNLDIDKCETAVYIDDNSRLSLSNSRFDNHHTGVYVGISGSPQVGLFGCASAYEDSAYDIYDFNNNSTTFGAGNFFKASKVEISNGQDSVISYVSTDVGDEGLVIRGEVQVGTPERPAEAVFGEGDSYTRGMLAIQYDASTTDYVDVSDELRNLNDGNTITGFTTGISGDILYLGTNIKKSNEFLKHYGVKFQNVVPLSGGSLAAEYYDGTEGWTSFNMMVTQSSGKYIPLGNQFENSPGGYQLRYDGRLATTFDWEANDPMGSGQDRYWVRFRVTEDLDVNPVLDQIKIHTSRTEINSDGYVEYFGTGRPYGLLPWNASSMQPTAASNPGNGDIWYSDNLSIGMKDNTLDANGDYVSFHSILPPEIDTSTPIRFRVAMVSESTGSFDYDVTWAWISPDEPADVNDGGAVPANAINEQTVTGTISVTANDIFWIDENLEIPGARAKRDGGFPDILALKVERTGGVTSSIMVVDAKFLKWCQGEHFI